MKFRRIRVRDPKTGVHRHKLVAETAEEQQQRRRQRQAIHTSNDELNEVAAARILHLSVQTLRNRRSMGEPPKYFKIGRSVFYRLSDILDFEERRRRKGNYLPDKRS
ncbi:helix-turn-helix transcriptional regulator [Ruegeria faecimaris]|uniref:helix-turn-helix transcriptional regulator n=1 Tax=Ruegeria faecimaris TaxID=686389 RepID=UPI00232C1511|nr:helix-turn-helix domain-containing protein [Ruegeria faecimaris]